MHPAIVQTPVEACRPRCKGDYIGCELDVLIDALAFKNLCQSLGLRFSAVGFNLSQQTYRICFFGALKLGETLQTITLSGSLLRIGGTKAIE